MSDHATGKPILVTGKDTVELKPANGFNERWLQQLIHRHPKCLPMEQVEPGLGELVSVCMELPLPIGFVDNLMVTPGGNLVMVEVKLWRNPEARRQVVAQALDYATALFELDYDSLEAAVKKADFDGEERPECLYDLVDGADALPEGTFVDRVNRNLREGRIVVLIVGDGIRSDAQSLVNGLQAHANFHFTIGLVEMPVYVRRLPTGKEEFVVMPNTLVKTVTVPRFTVSTTDRGAVVRDAGMNESEAKKPSRRTNITSEDFFEAMQARSANLPAKLKGFLDEIDTIDIYAEFLASLNLKWDQPEGRPVNMGYVRRGGEICTDASYWQVDDDLAEEYNSALARLFGGVVRSARQRKDTDGGGWDRWVARSDGRLLRIEEVADRFSEWRTVMEDFQDAIRVRTREREA